MNWFEVDKQGLGRQARERGLGRLIAELVRNSLDEDGVTRVDVALEPVSGQPASILTVEDDAPDGFRDLDDAFTMFKNSYKRNDPSKAGQFNISEKHALAVCEWAEILTTTGGVRFDQVGRHRLKRTTASGSVFTGEIRMRREEQAEVIATLNRIIPPQGIRVAFNGKELTAPKLALHFSAKLPTREANEDGEMRTVEREAVVELFDPASGGTASIFELGIPVVETGDRWHANVHQKVPLNRDRDNVTPAFLRRLRTAVLDCGHRQLKPEDAKSTWVKEAMPHAEPEAVRKVIVEAHGEGAVIFDPSCPEANKRALDAGRTVISGGVYSKDEWAAIRRSEAVKPAGSHQELRGDVPTSPDGVPPVPREQWKPEWTAVAKYVSRLCEELCDRWIDVAIYRINAGWAGACGRDAGQISLNANRLSAEWWTNQEWIDKLLIHEFAHLKVSDHLSDDFHRECCRLGAKLRTCKTRLTFAKKPVTLSPQTTKGVQP